MLLKPRLYTARFYVARRNQQQTIQLLQLFRLFTYEHQNRAGQFGIDLRNVPFYYDVIQLYEQVIQEIYFENKQIVDKLKILILNRKTSTVTKNMT